jgi:hypothetical protein
MAFRIDRSLNDYFDLAAELLANDTTPQFERGVFEMTAWTIGLNLSDPNDRGYLAVRLHLDLDRMYPLNGETGAIDVSTFAGDDGATVVQIDTAENTGRVRVYVNDGTVFDADPETGLNGVLLTRDQLESWADGPITDDEIVALSDAIPNSSIPSAIDTIVNESIRSTSQLRYFATGAAGDRMNYTATDDTQALDIARQANSPHSPTHYWGVWRADDGSYVGDVPATS